MFLFLLNIIISKCLTVIITLAVTSKYVVLSKGADGQLVGWLDTVIYIYIYIYIYMIDYFT